MVLDEDAHAVLTDFGLSKEGVDALYGTKCHGMDQFRGESVTFRGFTWCVSFKLFGSGNGSSKISSRNRLGNQGLLNKLSEICTYMNIHL